MGQNKSQIRKRSFLANNYREDADWDLPGYLQRIISEREEEVFYFIKDIYVASRENAERAPPCSGGLIACWR